MRWVALVLLLAGCSPIENAMDSCSAQCGSHLRIKEFVFKLVPEGGNTANCLCMGGQ